ncbi:MAG: hypothetical protein LUF89_00820 [Ruminococcus sp.]|nr:hypothetical protein [Ruminococcus sp.]
MTGKEFLSQYGIMNRQIRSVKLQLDDMEKMAKINEMNGVFEDEILHLTDHLKGLVCASNAVKRNILDKIFQINSSNRQEILIRKYIRLESTEKISKEIFLSRQGVYYHLAIGEKEIKEML